jgi:uncharacterized protein
LEARGPADGVIDGQFTHCPRSEGVKGDSKGARKDMLTNGVRGPISRPSRATSSRYLLCVALFTGAALVMILAGYSSLSSSEAKTQQGVSFPPRPDGVNNFINDEAGMLNSVDATAINSIVQSLLAERSRLLMVATITSMSEHGAADYSIERYAFELFQAWQIGASDAGTGMLLLVARDDRHARIELGYGWGRDYDHQAQAIMDGQIIPRFKAGQFSEGIIAGVRGLDSLARTATVPAPYRTPTDGGGLSWQAVLIILGIVAFFAAVFYSVAQNGTNGWGWATLKVLGSIVLFLLIASFFVVKTTAAVGGGGATGSW